MSTVDETNSTILPPAIWGLLSKYGREIQFPKAGILGQSAQAKKAEINATIGVALGDDGQPMSLPSLLGEMGLPPGKSLSYAPSFGVQGLRESWRSRISQMYPEVEGLQSSLPVVTSALTHALYLAGKLLLDKADVVVLPDLFWGNYRLIFERSFGVKFETYPTFRDGGYNVTGCLDAVRKNQGKRVLVILNFPHNPTGYACSQREAVTLTRGLSELAEARDGLAVLVDDAYHGLYFDDSAYGKSLFGLLGTASPKLLAVKVDGPTKEDYAWGLRVGFLTYAFAGSTDEGLTVLADKTAGAVRGTISNASHLSQTLIERLYRHPNYVAEKQTNFEQMKARYVALTDAFNRQEGFDERFERYPVNAGYFLCLKPLEVNAEQLRLSLLNDYKVGVISTQGLIRIAFSSVPTNLLPDLVTRLVQAYDGCAGTQASLQD